MPRSIWVLPASLVAITLLCFFNAINHPFVHDDIAFIVRNPHISQLDHLADVFFHSSNPTSTAGINAYYRPVLEIFYRLEYRLFGFYAPAFHLVNVWIHAINGLLLFALLSRLQFSKTVTYCISLLFLIHPIQSEAVACVSGISNLLAAFFILLVLYSYVRGIYPAVFIGLILALLTKEQAIILPGLLILMDWYRQGKRPWGIWLSLMGVSICFLWLRSTITGAHMLEDIFQSPGELKLRLLSIPRTIVMYLRMIVLPNDLHYYRNTDILQPNGMGFVWLGVIIAALVWFVKNKKESAKAILFGCAWFIICLSVVLNIIPLINEYSFILTAEHFLYLPMVGVLIVIFSVIPAKAGIQDMDARLKHSGMTYVFLILVLGLGSMTIYQNTFWRGEIPLFERTIEHEKSFGRGHILLAQAYAQNKQFDLAGAHFDEAWHIMKGYEKKATNPTAKAFYRGYVKEINANLAQVRMSQGNFDEAIVQLKNALAIGPQDVGLLNNLAVCYIQKGDPYQAEQYLKIALGFDPRYSPARDNLQKLMKDN